MNFSYLLQLNPSSPTLAHTLSLVSAKPSLSHLPPGSETERASSTHPSLLRLRSFSSYLPGISCLFPPLLQLVFTTVISCLTFNALASFFRLCHLAYGLLVPRPGTAPVPPAMELQSLNHWTGREVPSLASSYFHVLYSLSLEEEMATHSSIFAEEFHGQRSPAGYSARGRKESDTAKRLSLTHFQSLYPHTDPGEMVLTFLCKMPHRTSGSSHALTLNSAGLLKSPLKGSQRVRTITKE